jgi:flagellar hook-basal body complex protein FliE
MTVLPVGFTPIVPPSAPSLGATPAAGAVDRVDFADQLASSLDELDRAQKVADESSRLAATGDAASVEAHMAALTEVQLATQLTVAVRNRAVESFNEIMRMQL